MAATAASMDFWCQSVQLIFACVIYELRQSQQNQLQEPDQRVPFAGVYNSQHIIVYLFTHNGDVNLRQTERMRNDCVELFFDLVFDFCLFPPLSLFSLHYLISSTAANFSHNDCLQNLK